MLDIQIINELINVLNQESKIYEDILKMAKNKTDVIVKGRVTELDAIVKLEQSLVFQLGRLENMREKLVEKLATDLKVDPSELTISKLMENVKGEQANNLKNCQDNMISAVKDLKDSNELNSKLIGNSLDFINFSLNILTNTDIGNNNYGDTGEVRQAKKRNLFDVKL